MKNLALPKKKKKKINYSEISTVREVWKSNYTVLKRYLILKKKLAKN